MTISNTLGLIAGNGKFPFLFAQNAKRQNVKVIAAAIHGDTSPFLKLFVDQLSWFKPGDLKKLFEFFQSQGVHQVIMAGQVNPKNLFNEHLQLDEESSRLLQALKERKADTIFTAVADQLKKFGMELLDSTLLLKDYMAPKGTLSRRAPSLAELADIDFGLNIAKAMGALDVGQTVVVKEKAIVAIEAMEGTDRAILRGGQIARQGAVVVKVSKPNQDFRFDVPVIGPRTIQTMRRCAASCIAVEAHKTLLIDRERCVKSADDWGICIVGV